MELRRVTLVLALVFVSVLAAVGADERFTLVIDAGHGGHDSGAKGAVSYEKNLTLKYALAFGRAVERGCPDVKVVYTRRKDVFLPLHERADIANRNKADLFLSFHINALDHGRISHGFQTYTLGTGERTGTQGLKENLEVARRENSVIFMEKDYKTNYKGLENSAESDIMFEFIADKNRERSVELSRHMQREVCKATGRVNGGSHQNNLAVLRLTSMPAVLLELGFITTPDEEAFLNEESSVSLYTEGIYNAFVAYKAKYDGSANVPYRKTSEAFAPSLIAPDEPRRDESQAKDGLGVGTPERDGDASVKGQAGTSAERKAVGNVPARRNRQEPKGKAQPQKAVTRANTQVADQSRPVFKVQIFSSTGRVSDGNPQFKGLKGCECYEEGSYVKYTYGSSNNYNEINRLRKEVAEKFPEAFIVAFKEGKKINVGEGIREFLANKQKK